MRHCAGGEKNKRHRAGERVIQQECCLIRLEIRRQNASRLQIWHLAGSERDQLADAFMKSRSRAESQQIRNFRARVSFEIISVTEFVMRGEKPARVRFDALQRANVVLEIDVPAGGVSILLAFRIRRQRIQIRFFPETLRQRREPEPGVKLFCSLDNPFRLAILEILVDVRCFNQARPFLGPAIIEPVRWNFLWHRLMKFFGEFVFRPGVQLQIKRTQRRHPIVQHLKHLIRGHSVCSDLEREVIGILHLFGDAVTQIAQRYQIRFQCRTDCFRCFPDRFALVEIDALLQFSSIWFTVIGCR